MPGGALICESKFLVDDLQVSLQEVKEPWDKLNAKEKLQFAQAFSAKPTVLPRG